MGSDDGRPPDGYAALEDGYFAWTGADGAGPCLLGSYSPSTGLSFFPRRRCCPVTFEDVVEVELSRRGRLYSWTYIAERGVDGVEHRVGVGQVDLDDGPRIQAPLAGDPSEWRVDMPVELELVPVLDARREPWIDDEHRVLMTFGFRAAHR